MSDIPTPDAARQNLSSSRSDRWSTSLTAPARDEFVGSAVGYEVRQRAGSSPAEDQLRSSPPSNRAGQLLTSVPCSFHYFLSQKSLFQNKMLKEFI